MRRVLKQHYFCCVFVTGCSVTHIYDVTNEPPEAPRCGEFTTNAAFYFIIQLVEVYHQQLHDVFF